MAARESGERRRRRGPGKRGPRLSAGPPGSVAENRWRCGLPGSGRSQPFWGRVFYRPGAAGVLPACLGDGQPYPRLTGPSGRLPGGFSAGKALSVCCGWGGAPHGAGESYRGLSGVAVAWV